MFGVLAYVMAPHGGGRSYVRTSDRGSRIKIGGFWEGCSEATQKSPEGFGNDPGGQSSPITKSQLRMPESVPNRRDFGMGEEIQAAKVRLWTHRWGQAVQCRVTGERSAGRSSLQPGQLSSAGAQIQSFLYGPPGTVFPRKGAGPGQPRPLGKRWERLFARRVKSCSWSPP